MENKKKYGPIIGTILLYVVVILLLIFVLPKVIVFFLPFVIALFIAMIANPVVRFLETKIKMTRKHGSALIIILVLAGVIALLYGIGYFVVREVMNLVGDLPTLLESLEQSLQTLIQKYAANGSSTYLDDILTAIYEALQGIATNMFSSGSGVSSLSIAGSAASRVLSGLFYVVVTVLSAYFFTAERSKMGEWFRKKMPQSFIENYQRIIGYFKRAVGGYFKAQFKIMLVLIVLMAVWFAVMRVPYYFLLALAIGFLDFLPVFGAGFALWPWAFYCVIVGNYPRAIVLVVLYFVVLILHQLLQPKMVADSIGLSPLMTIFLLFVGYKIKGVLGMVLALPLGLVVINFYRAGVFEQLEKAIRTLWQDMEEYLRL